jgi:hypothetical protein
VVTVHGKGVASRARGGALSAVVTILIYRHVYSYDTLIVKMTDC